MTEDEKKCVFLNGDKVYLRPAEDGDLSFIYRGENCPEVRERLFLALPIDVRQVKEKVHLHDSSNNAVLLSIVEKNSHQLVGQTAFFRIDYVSRAAVFYLALLNPQYWSKKYGQETTHLMVDYAFETLNLNRIQLHVCAENSAAIRIYEKAGFIKEGHLRQAMFRFGKYVDFHVMGLIRDDWKE